MSRLFLNFDKKTSFVKTSPKALLFYFQQSATLSIHPATRKRKNSIVRLLRAPAPFIASGLSRNKIRTRCNKTIILEKYFLRCFRDTQSLELKNLFFLGNFESPRISMCRKEISTPMDKKSSMTKNKVEEIYSRAHKFSCVRVI